MCGDEVLDRIAAELLPRGAGELEGDRSLGDDGQRLDGRRITPLDERFPRLACDERGRAEGAPQGRQGLHRGTYDDLFAVRGPALDPAGAVRLAAKARKDLV